MQEEIEDRATVSEAGGREFQPIGGGFVLPSPMELNGHVRDGVSSTLLVEVVGGRAHARELTLQTHGEVAGLTSTDLRAIQFRNIMAGGLLVHLHRVEFEGLQAKVVPVLERNEVVFEALRRAVGYMDPEWEPDEEAQS